MAKNPQQMYATEQAEERRQAYETLSKFLRLKAVSIQITYDGEYHGLIQWRDRNSLIVNRVEAKSPKHDGLIIDIVNRIAHYVEESIDQISSL